MRPSQVPSQGNTTVYCEEIDRQEDGAWMLGGCCTPNCTSFSEPRASEYSQCALTSSGSRSPPPRNHRSLALYDWEGCAVHALREVYRDINRERSHSWRTIEAYGCNLRRIDPGGHIISGSQKEDLISYRHGKSALPLLLSPSILQLPLVHL